MEQDGEAIRESVEESSKATFTSANDAEDYLGSLREKLQSCIRGAEVDVHSFAKRIVHGTLAAVEFLNRGSSSSSVRELLLESPKRLLRSYKKQPDMTPEQKIKTCILQITLRMELMLCDPTSRMQNELVEEICDLLSSHAFFLPRALEADSLLDFSNEIIHSLYEKQLTDVVKLIYATMEFNGYVDTGDDLAALYEAAKQEDELRFKAQLAGEEAEQQKPLNPRNYSQKDEKQRAKIRILKRSSFFSSRTQKLKFVMRKSDAVFQRGSSSGGVSQTTLVAETPSGNHSNDEDHTSVAPSSKMELESSDTSPCHRRKVRKKISLDDSQSPGHLVTSQERIRRRCNFEQVFFA